MLYTDTHRPGYTTDSTPAVTILLHPAQLQYYTGEWEHEFMGHTGRLSPLPATLVVILLRCSIAYISHARNSLTFFALSCSSKCNNICKTTLYKLVNANDSQSLIILLWWSCVPVKNDTIPFLNFKLGFCLCSPFIKDQILWLHGLWQHLYVNGTCYQSTIFLALISSDIPYGFVLLDF